jgi:hypothetical protein
MSNGKHFYNEHAAIQGRFGCGCAFPHKGSEIKKRSESVEAVQIS